MRQIGVLVLRRHVKPEVSGAEALRDFALRRSQPGTSTPKVRVGGDLKKEGQRCSSSFLSAELKKECCRIG